jgi:hypothetical protein
LLNVDFETACAASGRACDVPTICARGIVAKTRVCETASVVDVPPSRSAVAIASGIASHDASGHRPPET